MSEVESEIPVVLLDKCTGAAPDKCNDVLFAGRSGQPSSNIVFFGGDVQDLRTEMLKYPKNCEYLHWNLESTAQLLHHKFSQSQFNWGSNPHVWVIRPSRSVMQVLAAYPNFLPFDTRTVPQFVLEPGKFGALEQLSAILRSASTRLRNTIRPGFPTQLFRIPLMLVGFSKGCCVLIQMLYELAYCAKFASPSFTTPSVQPSQSTQELLSTLNSIYWLDGGHSGQEPHQWPTKSSIISRLNPTVFPKMFIYGTPYQLMDPKRPWKSRDYHRFLEILNECGLPHKHGILFSTADSSVAEPDLDSHFELLRRFPIEDLS